MKCAFCFFCGILTLFAGCNSEVQSQLSSWQTSGNNVEFSVSCREFQQIAADEILPVPDAMRKKCIALLKNQEFCASDVEMLNELNCQFPPQQTFLVRAGNGASGNGASLAKMIGNGASLAKMEMVEMVPVLPK